MTTAAPAMPLRAGRCPDCDAAVLWTLRAGKRLSLDSKPIEVIPYDRNLLDPVVWRADFERVVTDTGEHIGGWRAKADVRPDLARVSGRTAHWGNCWPDDPAGRDRRLAERERLDEQRGAAGLDRRAE